MKRLLISLSAGLLMSAASVGAQASPIVGTFNISVYQGSGSGNISDPQEQAQQGNPLITGANLIASGTYTGAIDFTDGGVNDVKSFLQSAGGALGGGLATMGAFQLSASGFGLTSVFVITGTTGGPILGGTLIHDDGASLYDGAGYSNTVVAAPFPVSITGTPYSGLVGGFELIYVEANNLPADLTLDVSSRTENVPEPITLSLFGAGLAGAVGLRRRKKKAA